MRSLRVFGACALVAACSSSSSSSSSDAPPPVAPQSAEVDGGAPPVPPPPSAADAGTPDASSPGCGKTPAGVGQLTALQVTSGGKTRDYHLSVPADYDAGTRYPLVFVFHGAGDTNPENMKDWFPIESSMGRSAIGVYPQALNRTHADGSGGDIPRWDLDGDEDLHFFDAMLAAIGGAMCVDQSKVFATGFSSGGNFSHQLGCLRQTSLRAVAPVEGPGPFVTTCDGPIAIWMTHDVNDDVLPIADARSARDFWADVDGCGKTWTKDPTNELCQINASCKQSTSVVYCETTGVGHNVADFAPAAVGEFFAAQ
jgi:poly(3-hydroxybutyrate) depolymerase